ncbi:hypothetical protein [Solidesulfovibrio sp.]
METLSYAEILALEPRILEAEALARELSGSPTYEAWYSEIKSRIKLLVGWLSKHPDSRLHSSESYNAVYAHLISIYEQEKPTMNKPEITIDDTVYSRIPFGAEPDDDGEDCCPDCGIPRGEFHRPNCDQELCPKCHAQLIACECVARIVGADDGEGEESEEPAYDMPRSLDSSEIGRRLVRVTELLNGLRAIPGGAAAVLLVQEALREVAAISESNAKVMEVAIPF